MPYLEAIIVTSCCVSFAYPNWVLQHDQQTLQQPHSVQSPYIPCNNDFSPFSNCVADIPPSPGLSWQFLSSAKRW
ncbi:hypothetical protein BIW11_05393, partial [Tropilaelaps mercedesae]